MSAPDAGLKQYCNQLRVAQSSGPSWQDWEALRTLVVELTREVRALRSQVKDINHREV